MRNEALRNAGVGKSRIILHLQTEREEHGRVHGINNGEAYNAASLNMITMAAVNHAAAV